MAYTAILRWACLETQTTLPNVVCATNGGQVNTSPDDCFFYYYYFISLVLFGPTKLPVLEVKLNLVLFVYICSSSDIDSSNKDRPLTDDELRKFRSKRIFLVKEISLNGLLDSLYAVGCINEMHKEAVEEINNRHEKIRRLLDIIQRRSFTQYQLFLSCLRSIHQQHVSDLLERDGGKYVYNILCFS